jgi:hypothetical protein
MTVRRQSGGASAAALGSSLVEAGWPLAEIM